MNGYTSIGNGLYKCDKCYKEVPTGILNFVNHNSECRVFVFSETKYTSKDLLKMIEDIEDGNISVRIDTAGDHSVIKIKGIQSL